MGEVKKKPMRELMPETTAFLDMLRAEFPDAGINEAIRAGMAGEPRFWASENGHQVGTPIELGPDAYVLDAEALAVKAREVRAEAAARAASASKGGR